MFDDTKINSAGTEIAPLKSAPNKASVHSYSKRQEDLEADTVDFSHKKAALKPKTIDPDVIFAAAAGTVGAILAAVSLLKKPDVKKVDACIKGAGSADSFKVLLKQVRKIHLNEDGTDSTIKGFYKIIKKETFVPPESIKYKGKTIKLPDLNNAKECKKFWNKYINPTGKLLSTENRGNYKLLDSLPDRVREQMLVTLSRNNVPLTKYDTPELIKYRGDLNARILRLDLAQAKPTKNGRKIIKGITDNLYSDFQNSPEGIKHEKKLIVMLGQKAAGKSTLVDAMRSKYGVVVGDSDTIRDIAKGAKKYFSGIGTQETELHARLKFDIKSALEDKAIKEGANYLAQFHGTGTGKASDVIEKFKKAGYTVEIQNMEVPGSQLVDRIGKRKKFTGKNADPLRVIICGAEEQRQNFFKLMKNPHVSSGSRLDNSNNIKLGEMPRLIKEYFNRNTGHTVRLANRPSSGTSCRYYPVA